MKVAFGNIVSRFFWGGVSLSPLEQKLLVQLVQALPPQLQEPLIAQLDACNLVQREIDGRALNFYRKHSGRVTRKGVVDLPIKSGEVLLLKMSFMLTGRNEKYHATMAAVEKHFFCLSFSHDLRKVGKETEFIVQHVTESWRSNITCAQQITRADG